MGTGPFFKDIGGNGIALIIFALTLIAFLSWAKVIVDMKLITVWFDLNFKFLIIFSPTVGVTDKNIQSQELIISWLSLLTVIFLNFFFKILDVDLFLSEMIILLYEILELQIPVITADVILPVPIKPNFINIVTL